VLFYFLSGSILDQIDDEIYRMEKLSSKLKDANPPRKPVNFIILYFVQPYIVFRGA